MHIFFRLLFLAESSGFLLCYQFESCTIQIYTTSLNKYFPVNQQLFFSLFIPAMNGRVFGALEIKTRLNQGLDPHLYYYRDVKKREVDAIFQSGRKLIPIEIKASKTFNKSLLQNLNFFADLVQERMPKGYLVYAGEGGGRVQNIELVNFYEAWKIIPRT